MKRILAVLMAASALAGCSLGTVYDGDFFYLSTRGEYLPIWVRGNTAADTFVVFLHGGPGMSSMSFSKQMGAFADIEKECAVAYWDQRNSGSAQGNTSPDDLTIARFVEDTDQVIDLIRSRYGNPRIVLMGVSWGGALGTAYLIDPQRQGKVSGWIEWDGAHNVKLGFALSRGFVIDYANAVLNDPASPEADGKKWQAALDWYASNPEITSGNKLVHARYVSDAYGYYPKDAAPLPDDAAVSLWGPYDFFSELANYFTVIDRLDITQIDYTPEMGNITIPTLILWGKGDGILPLPLAQDAFDHLGSTRKVIVVLPHSAHMCVPEDFSLWSGSVLAFLRGLP